MQQAPHTGRRNASLALVSLCAPKLWAQEAKTCQAAPTGLSSPPGTAGKAAYLQGPIALPTARSLRYEGPVSIKGIEAKARSVWTWRFDAQQYQLEMKTKLLMFELLETSSGSITPEGLRPARYERKSRGTRSAQIDAAQKRISFDNGSCATWVAGVQDAVSVLVQLAAMMAGAPAKYPKGSSITVPVVNNRSLRAWTFRVEGEEVLNLRGASNLRCLKLVRAGDHPAELWLAPSMGYWPVRLKVQDEDDALDQTLRL
jgi:Protein of unknown function (DUF3108)